MNNRHKNSGGFSLIEVLVTLVVLSFSLFSIVTLQIKAQHFNNTARFTTQATLIAHDMLERIRSNPAGLALGSYNLPSATKHTNCYTLSGCIASDMAENDMYEWAGSSPSGISHKLPSGAAVVCIDSTFDDGDPTSAACDGSGDIYAIKVWWINSSAETQRFVTTVAFK
ncbi:MAG: type IV pilus modification protein PilV [Thiotrichaceae bacterium]